MPLFHDFLQIFKNKTIDMLVVAACLARNGFEIGCCSDEIIEVRTNLSPDSIQQSFKRLARCCAPGILVHPCARREVHFILTFLLHFVILHFKFRYKVFSIRIAF